MRHIIKVEPVIDIRHYLNLIEAASIDHNIGAHVPLADTAENEIARADQFGTHIAYMSPDEYITIARRRPNPPPLPNNLSGNMDKLRSNIETNGLRTLPWLSIQDDQVVGQEGLHRAAVLKAMGYERIPVRIFALHDGDVLSRVEAEKAYHKLTQQGLK